MANKYIQSYNTLAEYNSAAKEIPNVSLVKADNSLHFIKAYSGGTIGDILMYDVANQKLVATIYGDWDAVTYPIASYEPIAVSIYPAHLTSDGKTRWMSLKWMDNTNEYGNANNVNLYWGLNGTYTSTDQTLFNGRSNSDAALLAADGSSANTQAAFAAFYATNIFHTNGTSAGDWYVPSYKELSLYVGDNCDKVNSQITLIKNASSTIVNTVNSGQFTSTEIDANAVQGKSTYYCAWQSGFPKASYQISVRGMLSL